MLAKLQVSRNSSSDIWRQGVPKKEEKDAGWVALGCCMGEVGTAGGPSRSLAHTQAHSGI